MAVYRVFNFILRYLMMIFFGILLFLFTRSKRSASCRVRPCSARTAAAWSARLLSISAAVRTADMGPSFRISDQT